MSEEEESAGVIAVTTVASSFDVLDPLLAEGCIDGSTELKFGVLSFLMVGAVGVEGVVGFTVAVTPGLDEFGCDSDAFDCGSEVAGETGAGLESDSVDAAGGLLFDFSLPEVGEGVGEFVGAVGLALGVADGCTDGVAFGDADGDGVGEFVCGVAGTALVEGVGLALGVADGCADGVVVGGADGDGVGVAIAVSSLSIVAFSVWVFVGYCIVRATLPAESMT
ncbi:MAG: hypothetical protein ACXV4C_05100 [Halobacteriota archaeon]